MARQRASVRACLKTCTRMLHDPRNGKTSEPDSGMSSTVSASLQPNWRWRNRASLWITAAAAAVFILSWQVVGVDLHAIFSLETTANAWKFISGLFPPDLSPVFLRTVFHATVQTIATAIAASILSIVIGMPLAILASANLWRRGILVEAERGSAGSAILSAASRIARSVLGFIRAVP